MDKQLLRASRKTAIFEFEPNFSKSRTDDEGLLSQVYEEDDAFGKFGRTRKF